MSELSSRKFAGSTSASRILKFVRPDEARFAPRSSAVVERARRSPGSAPACRLPAAAPGGGLLAGDAAPCATRHRTRRRSIQAMPKGRNDHLRAASKPAGRRASIRGRHRARGPAEFSSCITPEGRGYGVPVVDGVSPSDSNRRSTSNPRPGSTTFIVALPAAANLQ